MGKQKHDIGHQKRKKNLENNPAPLTKEQRWAKRNGYSFWRSQKISQDMFRKRNK